MHLLRNSYYLYLLYYRLMWKIILCELLMLILHSWDKIQLVHDVSACFILLDLVCEYFRTSKPMFVSLISQ